ncbi:MAG: monofunctional biosynthetic peptidoglycan transglycosylase [Bacteroidia bacterium]
MGIIRRIFLRIIYFFLISTILAVVLFRFFPVPITPLMVIRLKEQNSNDKSFKLKKDWVPKEEISENLKLAVISSEDQNFFSHFGFDFDAIQKAYKQNKKGKKIKGASTISQQTAKNLFLWPGRSYVRKALEAYFTFLIEVFWSKDRILEVYLNIIEMGDGVYGAEAAANEFFNTTAKKLNKNQSALIAAVLPNPLINIPLFVG